MTTHLFHFLAQHAVASPSSIIPFFGGWRCQEKERERHQRLRDENTQRKRDEKKWRKNKTALDYCSTLSMDKPGRHMNKYQTDAAVSSNTPTHACVRASKYRCVAHTNQTAKQTRRVTVYNEHTHTQKVKKRRHKKRWEKMTTSTTVNAENKFHMIIDHGRGRTETSVSVSVAESECLCSLP